jgi:hypothetical protein
MKMEAAQKLAHLAAEKLQNMARLTDLHKAARAAATQPIFAPALAMVDMELPAPATSPATHPSTTKTAAQGKCAAATKKAAAQAAAPAVAGPVSGKNGFRVHSTDLFRYPEQMFNAPPSPLSGYTLPKGADSVAFEKTCFTLLDYATTVHDHPLMVIDLPQAHRVDVVQLREVKATYTADSVSVNQTIAAMTLTREGANVLDRSWLSWSNVVQRTGYKPVKQNNPLPADTGNDQVPAQPGA